MSRFWGSLFVVLVLSSGLPVWSQSGQEEIRATRLRDADQFTLVREAVESKEAWVERRDEVKKKILLSAGLWPEPPRTPLNAQIFGEVAGDGYTVSKVYFESLPGYLVTGNLYRPTRWEAPYPAVLTPHGHWGYGRLQNSESGSIPGRCIDLARMGFVVFSVDMIGYNDSFQLPHDGNKSRAQLNADRPLPYESRHFRADFEFPRAQFYGMSLGGLQLWNGMRALDFLSSLPDVDGQRLGVTGASGGATQTLLLMSVDDRVKVAAPVNIIGVEKHPGCRCENIPGLWVDTSTLEVAATFAPRPLLLISATEDPWTHSTPQREFPMIREHYELMGAPDKIQNHHVTAGHNYNAESRRAMYRWFSQHLSSPGAPVEDPPSVVEELGRLGDLRVFSDGLLPPSARDGRQIIREWIDGARELFKKRVPSDQAGLNKFQQEFREAMALLLAVEAPGQKALIRLTKLEESRGKYRYRLDEIGRRGRGDWIELETIGTGRPGSEAVLMVFDDRGRDLVDSSGKPADARVAELLDRGLTVFHARGYASGRGIPASTYDSFSWSDAYNRPNEVWAVQDILTALESIRQTHPDLSVTLAGWEELGIPTLFASSLAPDLDGVVVDLDGKDPGYEPDLMEALPVATLGKIGDFRAAFLLNLGRSLTLFNAAQTFDSSWYEEMARKLGSAKSLRIQPRMLTLDSASR